jgi:iron complex outermembrane receptor protein
MIMIGISPARERTVHPISIAVHRVLSCAGGTLLALGMTLATAPAAAQEQVAQATDAQSSGDGRLLDEVTVTGTRIVRDGYEAPTPVSVLGEDTLKAMAVGNIVDAVNRMPALSPTQNTRSNPEGDMTGGVTNLDLRSLGPIRTLVLLDGRRLVGSTLSGFNNNGGSVDINMIPNGLIKRVDVVTGGASAVYGSDALAGVVNFVLDKDFTGIKGEATSGVSNYGDDESYTMELAAGTSFGEDRGHFVIAGETAYNRGILHDNRPWSRTSYQMLQNPNYTPANGQPLYITARGTGLAVATPGGLVLSCPTTPGGPSTAACPLRGTQFIEGGQPVDFNFGTISGFMMQGGDWQTSRIDNIGMPDENVRRTNLFSRASFDVTDDVTVFGEVLWSKTRARSFAGVPQFHLGNITVQSGNPFIPDSIQDQMTAQGISQFTMGSTSADLPYFGHDNTRITRLYAVGVEGKFNAGSADWTWNAYAQRSEMSAGASTPGTEVKANFTRAVNTVVHPATGRYACAVNADANPANDDPACVPYNVMGIGVNSPAAIDYVTERGSTNINLTQDVSAASVSGEPWSTWAGPVSLAFGAEHRRESADTYSSELDQAVAFFAGNFTESSGEYNVTEGFVETVIPLAKDLPFAQSLDFNGAARWTDYSTSGEVTTWKAGTTWAPIVDLRFRATRSRDIRAPNLGELFNSGTSSASPVFDPERNNEPITIVSQERGNPRLEPEKADTTGFGVVYQPGWLPGFGASVDYFKIEISDAIVSLASQEYVDRCYEGLAYYCQFVQRDAARNLTFVSSEPANVLVQSISGVDLELSYNFPLLGGTMSLRGMATYIDSLKTVDEDTVVEGAGVNADGGAINGPRGVFMPELRYFVSAAYDLQAFSATLMARGVGSGVYNNSLIECTANCPAATADRPTIDNNHVDAVTYFDLSLNYKVLDDAGEVFFVTENLLNQAPPDIAGGLSGGFYSGQANRGYYDSLGRMFRAGVRFKF